LVATFLAIKSGPLLDLPRWVRDLSPLTHVPTPLLVMLAIASALVAAGLLTSRRLDLAVG